MVGHTIIPIKLIFTVMMLLSIYREEVLLNFGENMERDIRQLREINIPW